MAQNDLVRLSVRYFDDQRRMSTGFWYVQTDATDGYTLDMNELAELWWTTFVAGAKFGHLISDQCSISSVYCRFVQERQTRPNPPLAQKANTGFHQAVPVAGLRAGTEQPDVNAVRLALRANDPASEKTVANVSRVSGLSDDDVTNGALTAAYVANAQTNFLTPLVTTPLATAGGGTFEVKVIRQPYSAAPTILDVESAVVSSVIGNARDRQTRYQAIV